MPIDPQKTHLEASSKPGPTPSQEPPPLQSNVQPSPVTDITVPELLQKGTPMTKITEKKRKKYIFRIDPDEGRIIYSKENRMVPIEAIKELRSGSDARFYREQFKFAHEFEDRWLTIIYILDGTYETFHIIADTRDVFNLWDTTLRKLHAIRQGLMRGLGNVELRQAVWERQYWKGADVEGDQKLDFDNVERLCKRLNVNSPTAELKRLFKEADTQHRNYLDFADFQGFVKLLKKRPELHTLYGQLCSANGGNFDFSAFEKFMHESQKSKLNQEELKTVFAKYASTPSAEQKAGTAADAPPAAPAPTESSPKTPATSMPLEGFSSFLLSTDNSAFSEKEDKICHDMTRPISEYYISSSHNTYLIGHQLVGVSTIEGYIRALLHSCRSVELDIYDGDEEPVIYHGKTWTSKVSLRDVCLAIAKYAFVASPYPIIISAEVHCGLAQQDIMVDIMTKVFGDALIRAPVEGRPKIETLPSPEALKGKFLLKAKNLYVAAQLDSIQAHKAAATAAAGKAAHLEADPSSSSDDTNSGVMGELKEFKFKWQKVCGHHAAGTKPSNPKVRMSFALASLLVYTVGVKCRGVNKAEKYAPEHVFSLSENTANKLLKASMGELIRHNQGHVVRIYPKGLRVNSTNYEPHRYWAAGAQVVTINWQTFDLGYMINQAMFQRNGRSGYVLKPQALRVHNQDLIAKHTKHFFDVTIISAQQLPRPRDSNGQEIIEKSIVDPFVEVSLHIPDWTHSPFLPETADAAKAKYSPPSDATATSATSARTISFSTGAVKNNGFNPVWQEELCLPFDCVGDMNSLIFVEFAVRQEGKHGDDDEPLAVYCCSLGSLEHGFRHLPLHDSQLSQYLFSTLFVHINIRDIA